MRISLISAGSLLALLLSPSASGAASHPRSASAKLPIYDVQPIQSGDVSGLNIQGLNDAGVVVGQAAFSSRGPALIGFRWQAGKYTPLLPLSGAPSAGYAASANAVNDAGDVVGFSRFSSAPLCCDNEEAVIWRAGSASPTPLGFLRDFGNRTDPHYWSQSDANAINDARDVAGWSAVGKGGPSDAFLQPHGQGMTDIERPGAKAVSDSAIALAVNDNGDVLVTTYASGLVRANLWNDGKITPLPFRALQYGRHALNDDGVVVGTTRTPACNRIVTCIHGQAGYTIDGAHVVLLKPLAGFSNASAYGINDNGDITGTSYKPGTGISRATLWPNAVDMTGRASPPAPVDLNTLIPANPGDTLVGAGLINDKRQIVSAYRGPNGRGIALLDPFDMTVSSVTPDRGPVKGTNTIGLTGKGFTQASLICFGRFAPAPVPGEICTDNFKVISDTQATVVVPDSFQLLKTDGFRYRYVDVRLERRLPDGRFLVSQVSPADRYELVLELNSVDPGKGAIKGNQLIRLEGEGFTSLDSVCFGVFSATRHPFGTCTHQFSRPNNSDTVAYVEVPDGFPLIKQTGYKRFRFDVEVKVNEGLDDLVSSVKPSDEYTYTVDLRSVSPDSGPLRGGNRITVTGVGLDSVTAACFGLFAPATAHPYGVCTHNVKMTLPETMQVVVPDGTAIVAHLKSHTVHIQLHVDEKGYETIASASVPADRYTYK